MSDCFAEQVLSWAPLLATAPSAHNTQPVVLARVGPTEVHVRWNPARELTVSDPTRRDLFLSLGATVATARIVAAERGVGLTVDIDPDTRASRLGTLRPGPVVPQAFSIADLRSRRTARGDYAEPFVTHQQVRRIADEAALPPGLRLVPLEEALAATLLPVADRYSYATTAQVRELRHWVRLHPGDPRHDEDGLTFETLHLSRLQAWALDLATRPGGWRVLRRLGGPRLLAAASRIGSLGTVVALVADAGGADDVPSIVAAGEALLRTWLAAARHTVSCHPLSQLIDCPTTGAQLERATRGRVLSVFRIGHPVLEPPAAPRRALPVVRM